MNPWMLASAGFMSALLPCVIVVYASRDPTQRLVGLEMAGMLASLLLLCLAESFQKTYLFDLSIAAALLSFGGGLVFARFLERWV
jgi:multisubunit Na+/H+ antiporter MnhF subunit